MSRQKCSAVLVTVVILVAVTLFAADCPPQYVDTFDDPTSGWRHVDDPMGGADYVNGEYSVWTNLRKWVQEEWSPAIVDCSQPFTVETTAYSSRETIGLYYGILVGTDSENAYWFCAAPDGLVRIARSSAGTWENLVSWTRCDAIHPGLVRNDLRVTVSDAFLLFAINGTVVQALEIVPGDIKQVGLFVGGATDKDPAAARFVSFSVRAATEAELAQRAVVEVAAAATHPLPFSDDFGDPLSGWAVVEARDTSCLYADGAYSISVQKESTYRLSWAPLAQPCPGDFVAEASCSFASTARDASCGLVWGLGDEDFYRFRISADGFYRVDYKLKGTWQSVLVGWTQSDEINRGGKNRLALVVSGSKAMVEINGTPLRVVELPTPGPYKVGLVGGAGEVAPAEVIFTSFAVREASAQDVAALQTAKGASGETLALHEIPFADSFDDPSSGWSVDDGEFGKKQYADGRYSILTKQDRSSRLSWAPLSGYCPAQVSVEASCQLSPGAGDAVCGLLWGLGNDDFYWLQISADGFYRVSYQRKGVWQSNLVEWTESELINQGTAENRLRVVVSESEAMVEVNGTPLRVVELAMAGPYKVGLVGGAGVVAPAEVRFDSFAVQEATSDDAALLGSVKSSSASYHALPFVETFDFPSSGWGAGGSAAIDEYGYRSGDYFIEQTKKSMFRYVWAPLSTACPENFVVEVIGRAQAGTDAEYGIVCGLDGDSFYWFKVSASGRFMVQLKQHSEWQTAPVEARASQAVETGWRVNSLRLIVVGRSAAFQINGQTVALVTLKLSGEYKVGVAGGSGQSVPAEVRFTSFAVREAQPSELPSQTTSPPTTTPSGGASGDRVREP